MICGTCEPHVSYNTQARITPPFTSTSHSKLQLLPPIADCGATDTLFRQSDQHLLQQVTPGGGLLVGLPNGAHITSTATGQLPSPNVSVTPIIAHIYSDQDLDRSLVSLADFCNRGCVATLTDTDITITHNNTVILHSTKEPTAKLWPIRFLPFDSSVSSAYAVVNLQTIAELVQYNHATLAYPPISTLLRALQRGYLGNLPRLTTKMVRMNPPQSIATAMGHLDLHRQGWQSTRAEPPGTSPAAGPPVTANDEDVDTLPAPEAIDNNLSVKVFSMSEVNHADLTGRFPVQSYLGNNYILVATFNGYIYLGAMPSKSGPHYVKAYEHMLRHFSDLKIRPTIQRLDNETSSVLETFLRKEGITIQYVPPHNHRANHAERAIRDVKNYMLAMLAGAHGDFPMELWDELLPQLSLVLNVLRPFLPNPAISAYEGAHGHKYDFLAHPIAPCGTQVVIHESPAARPSWAKHGVAGFYLGPAPRHYRCFRTFAVPTRSVRISDTLAWFPAPLKMPGSSKAEQVSAALTDLTAALSSLKASPLLATHSRLPFEQLTQTATAALQEAAALFSPPSPPPLSVLSPSLSPATLSPPPLTALTLSPPSPPTALTLPPPPPLITAPTLSTPPLPPSPLTPPLPPPSIPATPPVSSDALLLPTTSVVAPRRRTAPHRRGSSGRRQRVRFVEAVGNSTSTAGTALSKDATPVPQRHRRHVQRPARYAAHVGEAHDAPLLPAAAPSMAEMTAQLDLLLARPPVDAVNLGDICGPIKYKDTKKGTDSSFWRRAESEEIVRLVDSGTIRFIHRKDLPADRKSSYYNPQCSIKYKNGEYLRRIRGTYGGNQSDYEGEVTANTADMATVKVLLHATISEHKKYGAKFVSADIKDFYLGTDLVRWEYMRITRSQLPDDIIVLYDLEQYMVPGRTADQDYVLVEIRKGIYGLPQAGKLAQDRLVAHLATHGYHQARYTPCLFKHETRPVMFTLVVDDFGIKYHASDEHLQHLLSALRELYTITVDYTGSKYLGLTIDWDYQGGQVSLSMPKYVTKALERFQVPTLPHRTESPLVYTPPVYGTHTQQLPTAEDTSPPLDAAGTTRIQQIVGVFLYYARAVDPTMLMAMNKFGTVQAKPTQAVKRAVDRFLQYAASNPDAALVYRACDMRLYVESDASYLCEPHSRSRAGGFHYLGNNNDEQARPSQVNGAIHCISTVIKSVVASAAEAEYAALFLNAQAALGERKILADMGYPQAATPLVSDNNTAVGVANQSVKQRKSKAIAMRFDWIQDRVADGDFTASWAPGKGNLADYFTKPHPVHHYKDKRSTYVHTPLRPR